MLIAAVQEERQRGKDKGEGEVESTSSANSEMPVEQIVDAELSVEPKNCTYIDAQVCMVVTSRSLWSSKAFGSFRSTSGFHHTILELAKQN